MLVELTSWRSVFLVNVPSASSPPYRRAEILGHSANLRDARAGPPLDVRGALLITPR